MNATFGEYIRYHRCKKRMTLTQLAAQLDLDSANLSKIENGIRDFDEKRLMKLAEVLNLNFGKVRNEYITDQIGKQIYEMGCTSQLLKIAEEKAEYRRTLKKE